MTKRQNSIFLQYRVSRDFSLNDVYTRCSDAKKSAYENCIMYCYQLGGYGFRIISHNSNIFTCGFIYVNTYTGRKMFQYMSKYGWQTWEI